MTGQTTALPQARVSHLTSSRLRVKIPDRRRDEAFFRRIAERLAAWQSIERVEINPLTASVLVYFSSLAALLAENAIKNDLFAVALDDPAFLAPRSVTEQATEGFAAADRVVRRWTAGSADLRGSVLLLLLAGGVYQLLRGNIAAPAVTLLWYAGDMLKLWEGAPAPRQHAAEG